MDGIYYFPVFIWTMSCFAIAWAAPYLSSGDDHMYISGKNTFFPAFLICAFLIYWMGNRPLSGAFGDTMGYYFAYSKLDEDTVEINWASEWLWQWIMQGCYNLGFSVHTFFLIIEFGYISSLFAAVCIFMPKNPLLGMLFVFVSFSFFTFGVNGLRNGLAVHILLLGMALFLYDKKTLPFAIGVMIAAFGIHRSVILPAACFFAAVYMIKNPKMAITIWIISVPVSLFTGFFFVDLFAGFGFDDRMEQYLSVSEGGALADSTSAFRWDFLLYSSMPVLMAWYTIVKREVTDNWYNILASTYCLSNAFWVLVIRASFTNRFAYLSWFIYPIAIAYPLIMLPVWEDQDNKTGVILIAYTLLTLGICYATHII